MAVWELFSTRQKKSREDIPDIYQYEVLPQHLKIQIVHIVQDTYGDDGYRSTLSSDAYNFIYKTLCKEYGLLSLNNNHREANSEAILNFFLNCEDIEKSLDVIEILFRIIQIYISKNYHNYKDNTSSSQDPNDAIKELNHRFKESGVGYQFESGEIIRVDSNIIHLEAVKPVLHLLGSNKIYQGSNAEFLEAHSHYRHQRYKECLVYCLKSFESLMKAICEKRSWPYNKNDTAKKLINICITNNLVPDYLQNQVSSIRTLLESGIPTIRNKEGGHGQGTEIVEVPEHLASYAMHLTATNLLFLANSEENFSV